MNVKNYRAAQDAIGRMRRVAKAMRAEFAAGGSPLGVVNGVGELAEACERFADAVCAELDGGGQ
jgi:hypothetical protein